MSRPGSPSTARRLRRNRASSGFTMVELLVVVLVLTIALTMMSGTMASAAKLGPLQRQRAKAAEAARAHLELLRIEPYYRLYALYNLDPSDDPAGSGTAPGPHFAVEGLAVRDDDADGFCGRVRFAGDGMAALLESATDGVLGLPRDLNANGVIDVDSVDASYSILPVEVIVEWVNQGQVQTLRLQTMLADPDQ